MITAVVVAVLLFVAASAFRDPFPAPGNPGTLTADSLIAMTDEQLAALDPLVMNLVVARGLRGLGSLDIPRYQRAVDDWATRIGEALKRAEESGDAQSEATYQANPDLWRAGGMAIALAGPSVGIRYTTNHLEVSKPDQLFVHGVIDNKMGTCASLPVLYLAVAHRLGWPLHAVVSKDHMWCRWDDAKARFNLEATNATSNGELGTFNSVPDDVLAADLGTSRIAIESGSDFTSLTARQTLGVYLQSRAAVWAAMDHWDNAEHDLLLARACFPQNREILVFLAQATGVVRAVGFAPQELALIGSLLAHPTKSLEPLQVQVSIGSRNQQRFGQGEELDRINRNNARRLAREPRPSPIPSADPDRPPCADP